MPAPPGIDAYINNFPAATQILLQQMRSAIREAAPEAVEKISYAIPTFYLHGNLVHFAAYRNHIGFYPGPSALKVFQKEIKAFKNSKGAVQFPLNKPLPMALVAAIVKFRLHENIAGAKNKNMLL